jgi:hypothetical protein
MVEQSGSDEIHLTIFSINPTYQTSLKSVKRFRKRNLLIDQQTLCPLYAFTVCTEFREHEESVVKPRTGLSLPLSGCSS